MRHLLALLAAMACAVLGCGPGSAASDAPSGSAGSIPATGGAGGQAAVAGAAGAPVTPPGGSASGASAAQAGIGGAGGSAAAGAGGSAGSGGTAAESPFQLLWRDDFDSFDAQRWTRATHTFEENLAAFTPANVVVEGGLLKLRVTNVPAGNKPYSAAEVYSSETFKYGRFEARIKFCPGSGMVSSLFTYKDNVDQSWQEIDVEHLGYLPKAMQYNLISGNLQNRVYQPKVVSYDFSPTEDFHEYAIEWRPDGISFYVDGELSHEDVQAAIQDEAKLRMNAWPANSAVTNFAGALDPSAIPCEAQYDWVSVYSLAP